MIVLAHYDRRLAMAVLGATFVSIMLMITWCAYLAVSGGVVGESAWAVPVALISCIALLPYLVRNFRHIWANDPMIYAGNGNLIAFDARYYLTSIASINEVRIEDRSRKLWIDTTTESKTINLFLAAETNGEIAANFQRLELAKPVNR